MMFPLVMLGLGALAIEAAKKGGAPAQGVAWIPANIEAHNAPPLAAGTSVMMILRNTTNANMVRVNGSIAGVNADGSYTVLLAATPGTVAPYGYAPGTFTTVQRENLNASPT